LGSTRRSTWITHMWCHLHYHSAEFFIIRNESFIFFLLRLVVRSCTRLFNIASNSGVWMLGTDCEHPTVETLRVIRKFSVVVLKSSYTRFLSGPLNDPAFNRKSRSRSRRVKGSFPYLSFKRLLYVSWKEK
jgi:hypothetical protein